ncbi:MAG: endonuclease Q family protein [bacterium]|nr:endonuclease Q family protein [bacterium]
MALDRLTQKLTDRGCNLKSDGRPIVGIDSEDLLKMALEVDPEILLIPAHVWTPWFALFGSKSGFDSIEECFGEMSKYIYAIETGLSSDPKMNARLSALDSVLLVSNSDAHSLRNLGREANVFEMSEPSYDELRRILVQHDRKSFIETIEFFPEEGKYFADGHRSCQFWCAPEKTKKLGNLCPTCGKPLTIGVANRINEIADRFDHLDAYIQPHRSIIPLAEIISSVVGVGVQSKKVRTEYDRIVSDERSEFDVLLHTSSEDLKRTTSPEIAEAIMMTREGNVDVKPGYDGEFGVITPHMTGGLSIRNRFL